MGERWIKRSESAIDNLEELSEVEDKDRLDLVKSIKYSLAILSRSIKGWGVWVNNPATMANFSKVELEAMEETLTEFASKFVEYDIESTQLGLEKDMKRKSSENKKIRFIV